VQMCETEQGRPGGGGGSGSGGVAAQGCAVVRTEVPRLTYWCLVFPGDAGCPVGPGRAGGHPAAADRALQPGQRRPAAGRGGGRVRGPAFRHGPPRALPRLHLPAAAPQDRSARGPPLHPPTTTTDTTTIPPPIFTHQPCYTEAPCSTQFWEIVAGVASQNSQESVFWDIHPGKIKGIHVTHLLHKILLKSVLPRPAPILVAFALL